MKSVVSFVFVGLLTAGLASGQGAKKFGTLSDLDGHFEEAERVAMLKVNQDKLAALDAYVKDGANAGKPDLQAAKKNLAFLRVNVLAETETKAPALVGAFEALTEHLDAMKDVGQAIGGARMTADRLVALDDIASAKAIWQLALKKYGDHPNPQVKGVLDGAIEELDMIGQDPKPFSVKGLNDETISLDQHKGKVVLIDFWATWCGPCVRELPNVIATYKKYHDKGFEVIGISLDREDKSVLEKFLQENPDMKWPQFYDGKFWKNELAVLYGVQGIPATYLLDKQGKIYRVGLRGAELDKAVAKLLAAK